ncbi:MAG: hypothetical protein AAGF11_05545 [Myxococcota bacterium]
MPKGKNDDGGSTNVADDDSEFVLGVEGPGIEPKSFDVPRTLDFIQAFLSLVESMTDEGALPIDGMRVSDGSVEFTFQSSNARGLRLLAEKSFRLIEGREDPMHGQKDRLKRVRTALRKLPNTYDPFLKEGITGYRMKFPRHYQEPEQHIERTSIRGQILVADGDKTIIKLKTDAGMLSLRTDRPTVERAGSSLYRHIDAEVEITYIGSTPKDGKLVSYDLVPQLTPDQELSEWRSWFSRVGAGWDTVDDIEAELRKDK